MGLVSYRIKNSEEYDEFLKSCEKPKQEGEVRFVRLDLEEINENTNTKQKDKVKNHKRVVPCPVKALAFLIVSFIEIWYTTASIKTFRN